MTPTLTEANAPAAAEAFIASILPYPADRYTGRGIVICAGKESYFTSAYVSIRLLRALGTTLPIELWHLGRHEVSEAMEAFLAPFGVKCVDASEVAKSFPCRNLRGWEVKSFAVLHSAFEEVISLDADVLCLRDPSYLFESQEYEDTGALLWPNMDITKADASMWRVTGLPGIERRECEAGILVFDKARCWEALNVAWWYNDNSDLFYKHHYGDTETWPNGFDRVGKMYYMQWPGNAILPGPPRRENGLFYHNDLADELLCVHQIKWSVLANTSGEHLPASIRGICEEAYADLKARWNGEIGPGPLKPPAVVTGGGKCPKCGGKSEVDRIVLNCHLSPGDLVTLTSALRDLHKAHPGRFLTDISTSCNDLFLNSPYVTKICECQKPRHLKMEYPLIHQSNQLPYHFIHGYRMDLERQLGVSIPATAFKGDIHLSEQEKAWTNQVEEITGAPTRFWLIVAGGKKDYTAKVPEFARLQEVVNHFHGKRNGEPHFEKFNSLIFVQIGAAEHNHPPLEGVIDLRGKTDARQLVRLMYHADGVVCPVTFAMHLAAAVPTKPGRPPLRPAVVLAGGREAAHWEAYPGQTLLSTVGMLPCAAHGGCWRSRVVPLGDGDEKDKSLCELPVTTGSGQVVPKCLDMITAQDIIGAIEKYLVWDEVKGKSNATVS